LARLASSRGKIEPNTFAFKAIFSPFRVTPSNREGLNIQFAVRHQTWLVSLACALGAVLALRAVGVSIDPSNSGGTLVLIASAALMSALRDRFQHEPIRRLIDVFQMLALFVIVSSAGLFLTYAAATISEGYQDELLAGADRALGFDWVSLYHFMDRNRSLMILSKQIYFSIFASPIVIAIAHGVTGRRTRYDRFLLAFGLALAITSAAFILYPARSAIPYWIGTDPTYPAAVIDQHTKVIDALRSGQLAALDPAYPVGLVSFPSFHAAAALLFIWGSWPFLWLRAPAVVLNVAMIGTTFVEGSHYLVDVLAGALVAIIAIAVARGFGRFNASLRWLRLGYSPADRLEVD
jgi:membrane-associated phospholipid phosphatase